MQDASELVQRDIPLRDGDFGFRESYNKSIIELSNKMGFQASKVAF